MSSFCTLPDGTQRPLTRGEIFENILALHNACRYNPDIRALISNADMQAMMEDHKVCICPVCQALASTVGKKWRCPGCKQVAHRKCVSSLSTCPLCLHKL